MDNASDSNRQQNGKVEGYSDEIHAEDTHGIMEGDHNYKYRLLEGRMMPPYVTPKRYETSRTLTMRPEDICFTSFPKSGSTWLAHILLLIANDGETPDEGTLRSHLNWVESSWTYPRSEEELAALPDPRIFKSHMPYEMALGGVPENSPCRHIYIARNPKDVMVSYYVFESDKAWSGGYNGPWEHWFESFIDGKIQRGNWFDHVLSWWQASQRAENILFLRYEELLTDFLGQFARISNFLGYSPSPEMVRQIQKKTAFDAMSSDPFSNMSEITDLESFFRKGRIGSWKERLTPAQDERFSQVIEERLAYTGLTFRYE